MPERVQSDAEALDLMQLELPEPVSMLPETLAWKVLLALLLAAAILFLLRRYQAHRKALWKRQALALARDAKGRAQADTWFALVKRVHLVHRSREELLKLDDSHLLAPVPGLDDRVREALIAAHYRSTDRLSDEDGEVLYEAFSRWLDELPVEAGVGHKNQDRADV